MPFKPLYWVRVRVRVKAGVRDRLRIIPLSLMPRLDVACPRLFWDCWCLGRGEGSRGVGTGTKLSPIQLLCIHIVSFMFKDRPVSATLSVLKLPPSFFF